MGILDSIKKTQNTVYSFDKCRVEVDGDGKISIKDSNGIISSFNKNESARLIKIFGEIESNTKRSWFANFSSGYGS